MIEILQKYILKKYDVISFDIFDTLIGRKCEKPSDIFKIAGENILGAERAEKFREKRIAAEIKARSGKDSGEVTLKEIYQELGEINDHIIMKLMEEEKKQEILNCIKKTCVEELYNNALRLGKKVILISDMYLPKEVIVEMLERCGIRGYSDIYISNCYDVNKLTGKLFEYVIKENHIQNKKMIHIGDSVKADFVGAHRAGICGILIKRKNRLRRLISPV